MIVRIYVAIYVASYVLAVPPRDVSTSSVHQPLKSLIKQTRPKTWKRSPFSSSINPRILNKDAPYVVNHYIYCDTLDQDTLSQIKSGKISGDRLLQLQREKIHTFSGLTPSLDSLEHSGLDSFKTDTYTADKEIHILHLPEDKPHDFEDVKLHLSLLDAHTSADVPDIDFDLNRNLGSFEVNLGSIKPPKLDSFLLPAPTTSSLNKIVRPLIQGHVSGGQGQNYNTNLDQISHYLNGKDDLYQQHSVGFQPGTKKEVLDLPRLEQHPLEYDRSKSSYDTPGAVDSYGQPVITTTPISKDSHQQFHGSDLDLLVSNEHQPEFPSGFQYSGGFYKPDDFFNQLNDIHERHRNRRQEVQAQTSLTKSSNSSTTDEELRYPNHSQG